MNEKQPHLVVCNYSEGPIGGPGCICIVVNRNEIDFLRRKIYKMAKGQSFSLVEYGVFSYPEGLEGWRAFRMEYGGANEDCIWEGTIWLPPWVDRNKWEDEMDHLFSGDEIGT